MPAQSAETFNVFLDGMSDKEFEEFLISFKKRQEKLLFEESSKCLEAQIKTMVGLYKGERIFMKEKMLNDICSRFTVLRLRMSDYQFKKMLKRVGIQKKQVKVFLLGGAEMFSKAISTGGFTWAT